MSSDPTTLDPELLDQFLGALVMLTRRGEVLSWNHGAELLYGYRAEEVLRRSIFDLIIPAERAAETRDQIERALVAGAVIYESSRRRKDGSTVAVAVSLLSVVDRHGRTVIAKNDCDVSHFTHLPQSQRLDAKFRPDQVRAHGPRRVGEAVGAWLPRDLGPSQGPPATIDPELLEQFLGALVMLTRKGEVLSWNRGAEILYGYPEEEVLGRSIFDLIIPAERAAETRDQIERALAAGAVIYESWRRRKDGSRLFVAVSLLCVVDRHGNTVIAKNDRDVSHFTYLGQSQRLDARFHPDQVPARGPRRVGERLRDPRLSKGPTVATDRLTARECEVMRLLAEGLSMKEVGVRLDIATKTAGVHAQNFMRKLDLHSRAAVVRWAIAYGLVELP
jgi:PAS domain S-box-containing protein